MEESRLSECQITRDIYSKYQVDFLANVDEISSGDMIKIRGWYYTGAPKRDNNRSVYVILRNTKGTCYRFKAEKVMRGDVEQHLSNNTCFVGYEAYFKADVLRHEDKGYEIGIQIDGNFPRRWFVRWTGKHYRIIDVRCLPCKTSYDILLQKILQSDNEGDRYDGKEKKQETEASFQIPERDHCRSKTDF